MKTPTNPFTQLAGAEGESLTNGMYDRNAEFLPELRGKQAIKKYKEMRDNDPIIGGIMHAVETVLKNADWVAKPVDNSSAAVAEAEFVDSLWDDMDGTFDEFISAALSYLSFGFSNIEMVFKRRMGPNRRSPRRRSLYDDGLIGIRTLVPVPQYSFERWDVNEVGQVVSLVQNVKGGIKPVNIPVEKLIRFRVNNESNSPMGRSLLRNAYRPYYYATHIESVEGIAIERELNGLPMAYIPSEILGATEGPNKVALDKYIQILRDVKFNEQGFILFPSDLYDNPDGTVSSQRKVEFKLVTSDGTRDINTDKVISRYRMDIARTILADFIMLGQADRGSFALSKSKTDLFISSLTGYANSMAEIINKQLIKTVWALNGKDFDLMPKMEVKNIAPVDLQELGTFFHNMAKAGAMPFPDDELEDELIQSSGMSVENRDRQREERQEVRDRTLDSRSRMAEGGRDSGERTENGSTTG